MQTESNKFSRDVSWNIASLALAGACGIILNYLIGLIYDEAALGIFNQVFAAYIFFSQIAALGVHQSALQGVAAAAKRRDKVEIATSALLTTSIVGTVAAIAFWLSAPAIAALLASPEVGTGMLYAAPGLLFFAVDKVTFACINAERRMGWYALLQSSRFVFMLAGLGICIYMEVPRASLPVLLSGAELLTLVLSLWAVRDLVGRAPLSRLWQRACSHADFGIRGFMSGVLADLHSRVDVLMLGYFSSDAVVGVYSFASIMAEGVSQLLVVLRANYAPICVRLLASNQLSELHSTIRKGRNRVYLASIPFTALACLSYLYIVPLLVGSPLLTQSAPYFIILLIGMTLSAGYMPFFQILLHAKRPGSHTWLILATVCVNVVCNAVLIPIWGPAGAAVATALAYLASALLLVIFCRRLLSLTI